jgi:adenine-specific DNA-methyltransferase
MMMDEVFGEENFVTEIIIQSNKRGQTYKQVAKTHEYCLVYSKTEETEISELEKGSESDLIFQDDIGQFNIRELRNRNPKFGKHNRPNLFYEFYVNPNIKDRDGFCPISLEKNSDYRIKILPLNSEGKESCWRWGKALSLKNISENTLKSNLVAKEKREGGFNVYEKYRKTTYKTKSIWSDTEVISEQGTVELGKMELSKYFDFPKPLGLIKRIIQIGSDEVGIILDFFAGSATTAHAVVAQNQEDGENRKFIMVQMPEPTDPKSEAYKAGYMTIPDIAKERIRRVLKGYGDNKPIDDGFKVFKLDKSNYYDNLFEYDPEKSDEENEMAFKDYLKKAQQELFPAKINEIDIIYENIIKEGLNLNAQIDEFKIAKNKVYKVTDSERELLICLDEKLTDGIVDALTAKEYKDKIFICFDGALTDSDKANLSLNLTLKTI